MYEELAGRYGFADLGASVKHAKYVKVQLQAKLDKLLKDGIALAR